MKEIKEKLLHLFSYKLQAIIGYEKDEQFTHELIEYLFIRFQVISNQNERYSNALETYIYNISNIFKPSLISSQAAVDELILNLELFVKRNMVCLHLLSENNYRSLEEKGNQSDVSYQKELWNKFEFCLPTFCRKYPKFSLHKDMLKSHLFIATGIRNRHAHQGTAGMTGISEGYRFLCGYDIILGYLLYSFLIMVIEINKGKFQLGKSAEPGAMQPQISEVGRIAKERDLRHFRHLIYDYLLYNKVIYIFQPINKKNPYKNKDKYDLGKDLTETFFGRSLNINGIGSDKLYHIFYNIFRKKGIEAETICLELTECRDLYIYHFLNIMGLSLDESRNPVETLTAAYKTKLFTTNYIPFDGNNYGASILKFINTQDKRYNNQINHFSNLLIVPEFIYSILIYVYMIEVLLDAKKINSIFTGKS